MKLKINQIKSNPRNPRIIKDRNFKNLVKSIKEFPEMLDVREIVVNREYMVLGGNMRLRAAIEAGIEEVPVRIVDWSEDKQKEFIVKDNISGGEWDWDVLANEWDQDELMEWGLDLPEEFMIEEEAEEDGYQIPENVETDIVIGDLFEIGEHRLLCGDSLNTDQISRLMGKERADMIFTDPPYNANYKPQVKNELLRKGIKNDNMKFEEFEQFAKDMIASCLINMEENASLYLCCNWKESYPLFYFKLKEAGINVMANIVWDKKSIGPGWVNYKPRYEFIIYGAKSGAKIEWHGERTEGDIWDLSRGVKSQYKHPTQKPVDIPGRAIKNSSERGDLILDLFLGSGTTMIAAHQIGRKCFGMELDPLYCQVIIDRMRELDPTLEVKRNGDIYIKQQENSNGQS